MLQLKAKRESGLSYFSFKRLKPSAGATVQTRVQLLFNLHQPTLKDSVRS